MKKRHIKIMNDFKHSYNQSQKSWNQTTIQYCLPRVDANGNPIKGESDDEVCCEDLILRHQYNRYHRFFLFSPMFLLVAVGVAYFASRGELPETSYKFIVALIVLMMLKEGVGVLVSRRLNRDVLLPIEGLKRGLFEVTRGNYDVEVGLTSSPEISDLIHAFNQMSLQLKASEKEKLKYENNRKELIASISHDLKTPITSINGFVDGILDGVADTPDKQAAYMKIIQQNARYMDRLIEDLLLYSKLDLHKLNFQYAEMNVGDYVSELFLELELEHEENGVAMTFDNQLSDAVVLALDSRHLTRAIRNIVNNAIAYGKREQAIIDMKLYAGDPAVDSATAVCGTDGCCAVSEDWVTLTITDNGPGIAKEQLERVFERFYRGEEARTQMSGSSGLGLAIAKEIVEAHQGKIWAISQLGEGTTLGISLPLHREGSSC